MHDHRFRVEFRGRNENEKKWRHHDVSYTSLEGAIKEAGRLNRAVKAGTMIHRVLDTVTGYEMYRRGYLSGLA